jgi:ATP-dependent RNA helicase RhlE
LGAQDFFYMKFSSLGLDPCLIDALSHKGYETPTPIQEKAIPSILEGHDLLAAAQTGTGKTAAFTLPILQRLLTRKSRPTNGPSVLVVVPTRELAAQVSESIHTYGAQTPITQAVLFGGVGLRPQIDALRRRPDIVVATPGRLLDLHSQGEIQLNSIEIVVLDEADRMLDMGFIRDIRKILSLMPRTRQSLLFSATFSKDIRDLAASLLKNPQSIEVAPRNAPAERVEQQAYIVQKDHKKSLLIHLITSGLWGQTLVFTRTKHGANRLAQQLERDGFQVGVIHGNKSQTARTRALQDFKENRVQVLVATDIAARGLDIPELPHVVNYELPDVPADYVHRIGRTGRAGAGGLAISLVSADESGRLHDIERLLGRKLIRGHAPEGLKAAEPLPEAPRKPRPGPKNPRRPGNQPAAGQARRRSAPRG